MVSIMYVLFICIAAPLLLLLLLIDKKSRKTVGFVIIGMCVCLFVSEINSILLAMTGGDHYYTTTTITPITEELLKALPVIYFAFVFSSERQTLLTVSMSLGIGFALLENSYILVNSLDQIDYIWALARGFGSGLMHGLCTAAVGYGISFVRVRRKLFYTGTFGLLSVAIIYHAIYNTLVQSSYKYVGVLLPIITYIPILIVLQKQQARLRKAALEVSSAVTEEAEEDTVVEKSTE